MHARRRGGISAPSCRGGISARRAEAGSGEYNMLRAGVRRYVASVAVGVMVAATAVVTDAVVSGVPLAHAVTLDGFSTRMEIDGNKTNGAAPGFDWNDIQDGTLPGGYVISPGIVSAGVVEQTY